VPAPHGKLTAIVRREALKLAAIGIPYRIIAEACGVAESTFHEWRTKGTGAKAKEPFRSFVRDLARARAQAVITHVAIIQRAARPVGNRRGEWTASAWIVERMAPDEYGHRLAVGPAKDEKAKTRPTRFVLEWGTSKPADSKPPKRDDESGDDD
jgi:hypothetical protein